MCILTVIAVVFTLDKILLYSIPIYANVEVNLTLFIYIFVYFKCSINEEELFISKLTQRYRTFTINSFMKNTYAFIHMYNTIHKTIII